MINEFRAFSAGVEKTRVNPHAIAVMKEIGIDISNHTSKHIDEFSGQEFDIIVTVCDNARESCPFFPGKKVIHKSFEDPSNAPPEEMLEAFRKVRNKIKDWLDQDFQG